MVKLATTPTVMEESNLKNQGLIYIETSTIINTVKGSEDLTWTNNGVILMSDGNSLFSFHPGYDEDWKFVIDFKEFDLTNISRISLDRGNNYIAIVAEAIKN